MKKLNNVHYSSDKTDWGTPPALFNILHKHFNFNLDACASKENSKCEKYYTKEDDALTKEWNGNVFINPPYGSKIKNFMKKAHEESLAGRCNVVALIPARTDTKWFYEYASSHKVIFIRGRIKFVGGSYTAPFPSCIVIFTKEHRPLHTKGTPWISFKQQDQEFMDCVFEKHSREVNHNERNIENERSQ